jgi:hypothetical protein
MSEKRESWSNWKLNTLLQCGEKFRLKFREWKKEPKKLFFARGNAVASVVEISHSRQLAAKGAALGDPLPLILSSSLPTLEEAKDIAADKFEQEAAEGGYILDDSDIEDGYDTIEKAKGAAKDAAVDMASNYRSESEGGFVHHLGGDRPDRGADSRSPRRKVRSS